MVEIRKGSKILTIPAGALKRYASAGWELTDSKSTKAPMGEAKAEKYTEPEKPVEEEVEDEFEEDVEYVDPEELAEKPLSELDKEELQILAEFKGLDTTELTTAKKLRAALGALE